MKFDLPVEHSVDDVDAREHHVVVGEFHHTLESPVLERSHIVGLLGTAAKADVVDLCQRSTGDLV